ncbi:polymerase [Erwinia typographi]|uniref:Polymerase n=1 Tax=Erwinia typographi TaxID=371042 RepID=A0A0A4AC86_9GAMM|nr:O-antigen ligase family protein [Erwinia typographi]KGT95433.1 polymerase [Erwinia typographi]
MISSNNIKRANVAFFLAFLFFSAIFCGYTKVNNLFHISLLLFTISLIFIPESRKTFILDRERKKGFIYVALFLVYFSFSNLWGSKPSNIESSLTHSFYLFLFLGMMTTMLDSEKRYYVLLSSIAGILILSLYCLIFEYHSIVVERIVSNHHPGPENVIDLSGYAAIGVILSFMALKEKGNRAILLVVPVFFGVIAISQSRGPIIALALSLLITLPFRKINKKHFLYAAVTAGGLSALLLDSVMGEQIIQRFSELYTQSFLRLSIWEHTLQLVAEAPFFGHGFDYHLEFTNYSGEHIRTTHSLYLGTLLKGGIVGLALLLLVLGHGLKNLIGSAREGNQFELALFIFMLIFYLSQGIFAIGNPTEYWYLFWFPLAFSLAGKRINKVA